MASAKSTELITRAFYMESIGKKVQCLIPSIDSRSNGVISSRTGLKRDNCIIVDIEADIEKLIDTSSEVIFLDEIQFFSKAQIRELVKLSDEYNIQFFCYGLKSDFKRQLFPAIQELLVHATDIVELKSYCAFCGIHKAIYNAKLNKNGDIITEGDSISPGYNYKGVCSKCFNKYRI